MTEVEQREAMGASYDARPRDVHAWTDEVLVSAVRSEPPNAAALDVLARRHWNVLFGRCRLLVLNDEDASDLAQSAWVRVLRARRSLDPQGNFPAYLSMIATNLWRDGHRSARRAGAMADHRLASLDAPLPSDEGDAATLKDVVPDMHALPMEEQTLLALEIDAVLARLAPRLREVLVARYLHGESAADIARRHGRTEQSISGWVRQAIGEMKLHLAQTRRLPSREDES